MLTNEPARMKSRERWNNLVTKGLLTLAIYEGILLVYRSNVGKLPAQVTCCEPRRSGSPRRVRRAPPMRPRDKGPEKRGE